MLDDAKNDDESRRSSVCLFGVVSQKNETDRQLFEVSNETTTTTIDDDCRERATIGKLSQQATSSNVQINKRVVCLSDD